jgi:high affinity sulfate transporter 1
VSAVPDTPAPPGLARWLPWLAQYRGPDARADLLAGSTLAAYAVPSSIAYAQLAGMPVQTGLYCYLFAGVAYAVLGRCRQLAVGPTSSIALVLATTLGAFATGDPLRYAQLATATAFLVALVALFAFAMRWGSVVHFISETVLTGFKIGAGLVIAVSQLPLLLGLAPQHGNFLRTLHHIATNLSGVHGATLAVGLAAYALLQFGQSVRPRWPIPLLVVACAIAAMSWPGMDRHTIATVGAIPGGLPAFALPAFDWRELDTLLPLALACFLIGFNEHIAAARLLALRHRYPLDANRELLGLAGSNAALSFGQGLPSGGGLSQSLVNDQAGARSPLALVVCSVWMVVVLLYLTGLFERLPQPLLAALVLVSVQGMFRIDELRQLRRVSMQEFLIAMVTIAAVVALGILKGVLVAAFFSLAMLIRRLAQPECVVLGRLPGADHFVSMIRHPDAQLTPGVLVFRANAALLYFNADTVRHHLQRLLARGDGRPHRVVLDLAFTTEIDLSTTRMLADTAVELKSEGIEFRLAEAHYRVRDLLRGERLEGAMGPLDRSYGIAELVALPVHPG